VVSLVREGIMARTRMVKPEFWDDEKLAKVSRDARLLFIGLWSNSDDYGVVKGHPAWPKNRIFPYWEYLFPFSSVRKSKISKHIFFIFYIKWLQSPDGPM
jgi:hypothetical protein